MFQSRFGGNVTPIYLRGAQGVGISNVVFDRDTGKIETTLTNGTVKTQDFEFGDAEAVNFGTVEEPVNEIFVEENRLPLEPLPDDAVVPDKDNDINTELLLEVLLPYAVPDGFGTKLALANDYIDAFFTYLRDNYDPEDERSINPDTLSIVKQHEVYEGVYKYSLDMNQAVILLIQCMKDLYARPEPIYFSTESKLFQVYVDSELFSTYNAEVSPNDEYCIGQNAIAHPIYTENNIVPRKMYQYAFRVPAITFLNNHQVFTCDFFSTNEIARQGGDSITIKLKHAPTDTPYDYTELYSETIDYISDGHKVMSKYATEQKVVNNGFLVFTLIPASSNPELVCSWEGYLTIHLHYVDGIHEEESEGEGDDHGYDVEL